ncbi:hypothetical protein [Ereboglobus luteus]|uniref:hypothetical protein n=1 Tax=Ereboglobus luteus TaxID=1796921 RepID=UPI0012601C42|nr:hypothetical protein [Ereboglobus luteus]
MHASPLTALSTRIRKHALGRLNFADSGADVPAPEVALVALGGYGRDQQRANQVSHTQFL